MGVGKRMEGQIGVGIVVVAGVEFEGLVEAVVEHVVVGVEHVVVVECVVVVVECVVVLV